MGRKDKWCSGKHFLGSLSTSELGEWVVFDLPPEKIVEQIRIVNYCSDKFGVRALFVDVADAICGPWRVLACWEEVPKSSISKGYTM